MRPAFKAIVNLIEGEHPFEHGSRIGRARATLLDQYKRGEIKDPRPQLEKMHGILDELLAGWSAHPTTQPNADHIKAGIEHGFDDSMGLYDQLSKVELKKRKQEIQDELSNLKDETKRAGLMKEYDAITAEEQEGQQEEFDEPEVMKPKMNRGKSKDKGKGAKKPGAAARPAAPMTESALQEGILGAVVRNRRIKDGTWTPQDEQNHKTRRIAKKTLKIGAIAGVLS